MRFVIHRFILGDVQIAENQTVYRIPFRYFDTFTIV